MEQQKKYQVKCKLRKGDEVIVLTGRSRGQTGTIDKIDRKSSRVYIGGVNMYKSHQKPDMANPDGGIIEKPMPLHISNVALLDPKTKKATRIGYQREEGGKKTRVTKASQSVL